MRRPARLGVSVPPRRRSSGRHRVSARPRASTARSELSLFFSLLLYFPIAPHGVHASRFWSDHYVLSCRSSRIWGSSCTRRRTAARRRSSAPSRRGCKCRPSVDYFIPTHFLSFLPLVEPMAACKFNFLPVVKDPGQHEELHLRCGCDGDWSPRNCFIQARAPAGGQDRGHANRAKDHLPQTGWHPICLYSL
jgi:hypothetical protein